MEFVSRLTLTPVTPGTFDTAFSTLALQAAQLMPVTEYCCILITFSAFNEHYAEQQKERTVTRQTRGGSPLV
jgi:sugar (pentulose or hexulose) kinase